MIDRTLKTNDQVAKVNKGAISEKWKAVKTNLKETPVGPWASVRVCDGGEEPRGWFARAETLPVQCNHYHHHHYLIVFIII